MKYLLLLFFPAFLFGAAHSDILQLNLDLVDPFTKKSFQEILRTNHDVDLATLIARVRTNDGETFYDAFALNKNLFDAAVPNVSKSDLLDPQTKQSITELRYFLIHSPESPEIMTIGSLGGMKGDKNRLDFAKAVFYANNPESVPEKRAQAFLAIGDRYATGKGIGQRDFLQALYWYAKALTQQFDQRSQAKANFHLGELHARGDREIKPDPETARPYFNKAAEQNVSMGSREYALYRLAQLDEKAGEGLRAMESYRDLAGKATVPEVKNIASRAFERLHQELCFDVWQCSAPSGNPNVGFKSPDRPENECPDQNTPPRNDSFSDAE